MFDFAFTLLVAACTLLALIVSVLLAGVTIQFFAENFFFRDEDDWGDDDDWH